MKIFSVKSTIIFYIIILFALALNIPCIESKAIASLDQSGIVEKINKKTVPFIANKGQIDNEVSYYAKTLNGTFLITKKGEIIYDLRKIENSDSGLNTDKNDIKFSSGVVIRENLVNASGYNIKALHEAVTRVSSFRGNDKNKWKSHVRTYEEVTLGEVYEGIEFRLKAYDNNVEKLFYVKPGADPTSIKLSINGAEKLKVLDSGELQISTKLGNVNFTNPVAWQEINGKHIPVAAAYHIETNDETLIYSFQIESYDKSSLLIIDPLLASTFLGGIEDEYGEAVTFDSSGNVYVAARTFSSDYPTTTGAYDETYNDPGPSFGADIIISKLSPDLSTLIASTYIGGDGGEEITSITIDDTGNVYVTGTSSSTYYPTTNGTYSETNNGGIDIIISKFSSDLSTLLASTYLGGTGLDSGRSTFDSAGNVYVTGYSNSTNYPVTPGAYDETHNGNFDVIISKLTSDLSTLLSSTYFGGTDDDRGGKSVTLDSADNVYVTGYSSSTSYPTTLGAFDQVYNGGSRDVIIMKVSSDLSTLLASTYLGGMGSDYSNSIILDSTGNIYVTGYSSSTNFPSTSGAYDETYNGSSDVTLSKFSPDLSNLLASTYLGGTGNDAGISSTIDSMGNIFITGHSQSIDYPTTTGAYDDTLNNQAGTSDIIISKLSPELNALLASTYIGGADRDAGESIALDGSGNVYVIGHSDSTDYPTTSGAFDETHHNNDLLIWDDDVVITKLSADLSANTYKILLTVGSHGSISPPGPISIYENRTQAFTITPEVGYHINSISGCNGSLSGNTFTTDKIGGDCTINLSFAYTCFEDLDQDGYGSTTIIADNGNDVCETVDGESTTSTDCNDNNTSINPGSLETCDGVDNDCNPATDDGAAESWINAVCDGTDSDLCEEGTYSCSAGSQTCSDTSGDNIEICDGIDNDCNPATDDGASESWINAVCDGTDSDLCEEGTYSCSAGSQTCSDTSGDNIEICDGVDNDCDGEIDEDLLNTYYIDFDHDTFGDPNIIQEACTVPIDYVIDNSDCDDTNPDINPIAIEICDKIDNNCDAQIDENRECSENILLLILPTIFRGGISQHHYPYNAI